jgi:hypothetical protein
VCMSALACWAPLTLPRRALPHTPAPACAAPQFLHKLAPPSEPYLHNDLHLREAPADWPGGWAAWCGTLRVCPVACVHACA